MNRKELIKSYIEFFKSKGHKEIPNHSLVPENDPTVLFTTAGMHPLVPYLLGEPHPLGKRLVNVQRCLRTDDIKDVGDSYHHTFFEMLGNWSLGDYFKKEAIQYSFEFLTKVLRLPIDRLAVSCFAGDKDAPRDEESAKTWLMLGIPKERIVFLPKGKNWWGPAGKTGPCGPDTEMFYWRPNEKPAPKKFNPEDENWVEIWNDVLMEYTKDENSYQPAKQKNIDTGMGVERTITILSGLEDNYLSTVFLPIIKKIEEISKKNYKGNEKAMRIIADHIKASVFATADGIYPSNTEQGYVLRRLIRRSIRYGRNLGIKNFTKPVASVVFDIYYDYEILRKNKEKILEELEKEENKFLKTLENGIKVFEKIARDNPKGISGKNAFLLYQSYGFPLEMTKELAEEKNIRINEEEFYEELKKHQEKSRTATQGKFKSGLADDSDIVIKYHTATHLLHSALRKVLGEKVQQKGSNITKERLRFDFNFDRKLTTEEIKKIENIVNQAIKNKLPVTKEEMSPEKAKKNGALGFFENKYGDIVTVYTIGGKEVFSREICTGPHVKNTSELGHFKIIKEESAAAGIRRIKAILE